MPTNSLTIIDLSSKIKNENLLRRRVSSMIGYEFSEIGNPCYIPKFIRYKNEIAKIIDITKYDIQTLKNSISAKYRYSILVDSYTLMLIIPILYFSSKRKEELSRLFFNFIGIKFYSSILHRFFPKFCSDEIWTNSLNTISSKHLFKVHNGISSALMYINNSIYDKYKNRLSSSTLTDRDLYLMIYELRTRIFQSIRSFAENYYEISKTKVEKQTDKMEEDSEVKDVQYIADKISMSICTFRQIDEKGFLLSIKNSGIKKEIAKNIMSEMSVVDYKSNVQFILVLILRMLKKPQAICKETTRRDITRKIIEGQKTLNYSVEDEIMTLIKSLPSGFEFKNLNKKQVVNYLANYFTYFIQSKIC